jgi:prophage tail gpP-like protein
MGRLPDKVRIEIVGDSGSTTSLDNFNSLSISMDLTQPYEAAFELGDDGTWDAIEDKVAHGTQYKIFVNDRIKLTGRVELDDIPIDADSGAEVRFTVRTKLADAAYASADPKIRVKDTTIEEFLIKLYEPLGYTESDFVFEANVARDLLTGKDTSGKGQPLQVDLEPLKVQQARINPPETIFQAADRHLRRHGYMHWDSPDGKIVVSAPNDSQNPQYYLRINRGPDGAENNILRATRTQDWSGIPSVIGVFGRGGKRGRVYSRIGRQKFDQDVYDAGFVRPVMLPAEGLKTDALADHAAARELSARSKNKDAWQIEMDGLSYWHGDYSFDWGVDTVASVSSNIAGLSGGPYYIHRIVLQRDADNGDRTNLTMLAKGIWKL